MLIQALNLDADTAKAMVQAADLGTNIQRLKAPLLPGAFVLSDEVTE